MKRILATFKEKWPEYLIEAIVIIASILGAYALDNWNEQRLQKTEEQQILNNIYGEFRQNRNLLKKKLALGEKSYQSGIKVINLMGASRGELAKINLDSLLYTMLPASGDFIPINNAISNIIQSGKLNLISNDSLISRLHDWESSVTIPTQAEISSERWITTQVMPYIVKYISMKEMDSYGGFEWTGKSKLKPDYYPLFQKLPFENALDNMLFHLNNSLNKLKESDLIIIDILALTKAETNLK
jgi:hypothetical protein